MFASRGPATTSSGAIADTFTGVAGCWWLGVPSEIPSRTTDERRDGKQRNDRLKNRFLSLFKAVETGAILQQLPPPKPAKRVSLSGGQFVLLAALSAILVMTIAWAITVWTSSNDVPMSKHGWIALGLGTVFSLVIGCGLMALMFFSSRSGHDEAATPKFMRRREKDE